MTVGKRLKELRGKRSLQLAADRIGISKSLLARAERDEVGLSAASLAKVSNYYKVPVDHILRGTSGDSSGLLVLGETENDYGASPDELQVWLQLYTATPIDGRRVLSSIASLLSEREQEIIESTLEENEEEQRWIALGEAFAERIGVDAAEELMSILAAEPEENLFSSLSAFFARLAE